MMIDGKCLVKSLLRLKLKGSGSILFFVVALVQYYLFANVQKLSQTFIAQSIEYRNADTGDGGSIPGMV